MYVRFIQQRKLNYMQNKSYLVHMMDYLVSNNYNDSLFFIVQLYWKLTVKFFFTTSRRGTTDHQSRIWQQFGGDPSQPFELRAMILESCESWPFHVVDDINSVPSQPPKPFICRDQTTNNNFSPSNYK